MSFRLLKQFLYGFFYLAILAAILWRVYSITLKPEATCFDNKKNGDETGIDCGGSCIACDIKNLKSIEIRAVNLFANGNLYSISAEIHNPNFNFGAKLFNYEVNFYSAGNELLKIANGKSFIYAGKTKVFVLAGVGVTGGVPVRAELKIDKNNIIWERPENFSLPSFKLGEISSVLGDNQVIVSGFITNPNNFIISKFDLSAFLIDGSGKRIGVSNAELKDVGPFRAENFKIFIPVPVGAEIDLDAVSRNVFIEALK